jgi:poly(3-hydroxybutyrate) depolymerase
MRLRAVILVGALALVPCILSASDVSSHVAHCKEGDSKNLLFRPEGASAIPALLLLHGSGDHPGPMIDAWKDLARKEHFVLIAPELPLDPKFEEAAPAIFRCDVEDAKQAVSLDARRVYVFGHSMGGYLAYDAATLASEYFAAVAVHAMRIADEYTSIVGKAKRKTPIAIYIGDRDQFIALDGVRKTRDLLKKSGFPLHYVELPGHDHNYYAVADQVNSDVWKFLKKVQLPAQ